MSNMLSGAYVFNGNLSSWTVSSVTNMTYMFYDASVFNQPLSSWDVSSVTDMSGMFTDASVFNQPLSSWDVSSVARMSNMFAGASVFNKPLSSWTVSSVTDMSSMFDSASSFNQPLSSWDVSSVTKMSEMFYDATLFDQNLGNWYVVPEDTTYATSEGTLNVTTISTQNAFLDDPSPSYAIGSGGNSTLFNITDSNTLMFKSTPSAGTYNVTVTASGTNVFESGNHWRLLEIEVTGQTTDTTPSLIAGAFVTTWRTATDSDEITLPLSGADITINWGDGSTTTGVSMPIDHTYGTAGDYTVRITGDLTGFHLNDAADASKLVSLDQWGTASWASMENAFRGADNMVYNAGDAPDLSGVTDMTGMFYGASDFNGNISGWGVSSVTDMTDMFAEASSFNQPLSSWDVSSVTNMTGMFYNTSDFNGNLSGWDVFSVTDMTDMFYDAASFNQTLSSWDVSSVTDMSNMLSGAYVFNGNLSSWTVSSVTNMTYMFYDASVFNQPLSSWDVSSVTDMSGMFTDASVFNKPLSSWTVSSVTDMSSMFAGASVFNKPLSSWTVSSVTDMSSMFDSASSFNQPLSSWDVSSVTKMSEMFYDATLFDQNLGNWYVVPADTTYATSEDTLNVTTISTQNAFLDDPSPSYAIGSGGNSTLFNITDSNTLMFKSTPSAGTYNVTVTASGTNVFESGNHWRVLVVRVSGDNNADLDSLTISSGTLSPAFSSSVITYAASVGNSVTEVTLTPTASDGSAMIAVNGNTVTSGTGYLVTGLTVGGTNTITVLVTAQDSVTTKTYTVTLTRAAPPSNNADLDSLTISSGTLSPAFSSSVITYAASVGNSVTEVTLTPTASDGSAMIAVNGNTVTSGTGYLVTGLTVGGTNTITVIVTAQDSVTTKTYTVTLTRAAPPSNNADLDSLTISSGTLSPAFSSSVITYAASVGNSVTEVTLTPTASDGSAMIAVNDNTVTSGTGYLVTGLTVGGTNTITVIVTAQDSTTTKTYTVTVTVTVTGTPNTQIGDTSKKKSSSSKAPLGHISALAQARIVDIPPHIAEQVASHDASDPLEPITPDDTFDLPLVINGYGYLLDDTTNTLVPQTVMTGDDSATHITFTVYTQKDLAYFTLYLNLSDENIDYADSDTYITYKDDGTTSVTDPHGYIGSATVTVTQEDDQIPEKRTVRITIEFGEEPMGPTNMVAYMWNTDRKAAFIKIIDAFEVVAALLEPVVQAADPEPLEPDSVLPADPEPVAPDLAGDAADPEPMPADTLWPDDYDEAQVLHIIRMWSGFESEFITDTQMLDLLGLEDYQDIDLPDWMMTELGVLVAKGDVTVGQFVLALQYMLTHA